MTKFIAFSYLAMLLIMPAVAGAQSVETAEQAGQIVKQAWRMDWLDHSLRRSALPINQVAGLSGQSGNV
ncbi:MAG: hypothetical protein JO270_26670 [Acidobacteriaceae bacterium]|nr:hypothetical protein [Acidobacteriaceae bacterium]